MNSSHRKKRNGGESLRTGLWGVRIYNSSQQLGDRPLGWVPQSSALSSSDSESALFSTYDIGRRLRVGLLANLFAPVRQKRTPASRNAVIP
jgi:hypothetical protein